MSEIKKNAKILFVGCGMMSFRVASYCMMKGHDLILADKFKESADQLQEKLVEFKQRHKLKSKILDCMALDLDDKEQVLRAIKLADVVASLVPPPLHHKLYMPCFEVGVHFANASYCSDELKLLAKKIAKKNVLFAVEMGVDPGIDLMQAKEIIDEAQSKGETVEGFFSSCGGLTAPESCLDTSIPYKPSWTLLGSFKPALYDSYWLEQGVEASVPHKDLLIKYTSLDLKLPESGPFALVSYPNRNSVSYREELDLTGIQFLQRATIRFKPYLIFVQMLKTLGLMDESLVSFATKEEFYTFVQNYLQNLPDMRNVFTENDKHPLVGLVKNKIRLNDMDNNVDNLKLIESFLDEIQIFNRKNKNINLFLRRKSPLLNMLSDYLSNYLTLDKGDRDLIIMHHWFRIRRTDGSKYRIDSTMAIKGDEEFSAMQSTVGLTLGIAIDYIISNRVLNSNSHVNGLLRPTNRDFYKFGLQELAKLGIKSKDTITEIKELKQKSSKL